MTLAITINLILSAIVFMTIVGFLAAAIMPPRRGITPAPASGRTPSLTPARVAAATGTAGWLA